MAASNVAKLRTNTTWGPPRPELANLLFGAYRYRVLSLLLLRPGESFHVRRIARLTDVPAGSLYRELRLLAGTGLLRRELSGNQVRYAANSSSPVYKELASVLDKTAGPPPTLDSPVGEYAAKPTAPEPKD